jgi:hypothetical protein
MKEIATILRQAVLFELLSLNINGTPIPVLDEIISPSEPIPTIAGAKVYCLVTDQFETPTTNNKCQFRELVTVVIQIITKYPKGTGGKMLSEEVSDRIQQALIPFNGNTVELPTGWQLLETKKGFSNSFLEATQHETVFRKIISINFDIFQA